MTDLFKLILDILASRFKDLSLAASILQNLIFGTYTHPKEMPR
jgi:hypothetical protein